MIDRILAILLAFQPAQFDLHEDHIDRHVRLSEIAEAINRAADVATCTNTPKPCTPIYRDRRELASLLIVLAWYESHFASNVQACQCRRFECDPYRSKGELRQAARGLWQLHRFGEAQRRWDTMCHDVSEQAWAATVLIAGSVGQCRSVGGGLARFGSGSSCAPKPWAIERAALAKRMEERL